jgi:hypothetical protein
MAAALVNLRFFITRLRANLNFIKNPPLRGHGDTDN